MEIRRRGRLELEPRFFQPWPKCSNRWASLLLEMVVLSTLFYPGLYLGLYAIWLYIVLYHITVQGSISHDWSGLYITWLVRALCHMAICHCSLMNGFQPSDQIYFSSGIYGGSSTIGGRGAAAPPLPAARTYNTLGGRAPLQQQFTDDEEDEIPNQVIKQSRSASRDHQFIW